jgi:hypothetical protein
MTTTMLPPEAAEQFEQVEETKKDAVAALIATFADLGIDLKTLRGAHDGYDFHVDIPASKMHEMTQRMVQVQRDVEENYSIRIQVLAIPVEDRT